MNDKHIEDILRESWSPEPPDGLRERVLSKGREELLRDRDPGRQRWFTWRVALVGAGVAILLVTNLMNISTESQVAQMLQETRSERFTTVAQRPVTLGEWRRSMDEILLSNGTNPDIDGLKGVETP